ncbi:hypothetical protein OG462_39075 [Streptomyces sp. NBC_01077]|uniref:hypothetical protein n=1 Tax=Streptomyces sp. NBC_01077 TaxID=2903746 RepID=UPI0038642B5E|nr:hypothetical protein OG462_39075 [Streptomyces sp. NBC_01077]
MHRTRAVIVGTVGAALLAAAGTGCDPGSGTPAKATTSRTSTPVPSSSAPVPPSSAPAPAPAATHRPSVSPSSAAAPTPKVSAAGRPASRTAPPPKTATTPPAPTYLAMHVATPGGRLDLKPGGAAQEFTVTLRNGNTRAYRHLLLAFQMEVMPGGTAGPAYVLEGWDRSTGTWRTATLRLANDAYPYALYTGGTPLAKNAVSTLRYRVRASAGAPSGPNPILISLIDTDTDVRAHHTSLPQKTGA